MTKLKDVSADRLREVLADVSDAKVTKRLMSALAQGRRISRNGERAVRDSHDNAVFLAGSVRHAGISEAVADEQRPGRPTKLPDSD